MCIYSIFLVCICIYLSPLSPHTPLSPLSRMYVIKCIMVCIYGERDGDIYM